MSSLLFERGNNMTEDVKVGKGYCIRAGKKVRFIASKGSPSMDGSSHYNINDMAAFKGNPATIGSIRTRYKGSIDKLIDSGNAMKDIPEGKEQEFMNLVNRISTLECEVCPSDPCAADYQCNFKELKQLLGGE